MDQGSIKCCFCCAAFALSGLDLSENGRNAIMQYVELSIKSSFISLFSSFSWPVIGKSNILLKFHFVSYLV